MKSKLLGELNAAQREGVEQVDGPMLILAGAGSGKTRVLTYRIGYLLEQGLANPREILAVTFTNKAAREMRSRVEALVGSSLDAMWLGTFHSICARIMRIEGRVMGYTSSFTIYDVDDQIKLIQQVMNALSISQDVLKPRSVQYAISKSKNQLLGVEQFTRRAGDHTQKKIARIFAEYEQAMRRNNALDFDDLLIKPLDLFTTHPEVLEKYQKRFRYILVDEYQDTNKPQYYFVRQLSGIHHNLCVVGDEDQSIYRWRGADIENILGFEKDYPDCRVVRLEQNYRSTQTILSAANAVVAHNSRRLGKNLWSSHDGGEKIAVRGAPDETAEAAEVVAVVRGAVGSRKLRYRDIAVLYRTNAQSRALEDQLRRNNIPYIIVGGLKFYERKEIKDILAYLRVVANTRDAVALQRIINFPTRGIGAQTLLKLDEYARERQIPLYSTLLEVDRIDSISPSIQARIVEFVDQMETFRERLDKSTASELAHDIVEQFGLRKMYELSNLPEDEARLENINELMNSIVAFTENAADSDKSLSRYLEDVSLMTDIDRWDPSHSAVTLMTLHSAKGLEFPVVILTGMEDGLFPLFRSTTNEDDLEEERRLFYVGLTRAKEKVCLLWAQQRRRFTADSSGMSFRNTPSRFLMEIPQQFKLEKSSDGARGMGRREAGGYRRRRDDPASTNRAANRALNSSTYKVGNWVIHDTFGRGQILGVEPSSQGTKISVLFANKSLKKLIAEYANLQIVEA